MSETENLVHANSGTSSKTNFRIRNTEQLRMKSSVHHSIEGSIDNQDQTFINTISDSDISMGKWSASNSLDKTFPAHDSSPTAPNVIGDCESQSLSCFRFGRTLTKSEFLSGRSLAMYLHSLIRTSKSRRLVMGFLRHRTSGGQS